MYSELEKCRKIARRLFKREKLSVPVDILSLVQKYADLEGEDIPYEGDAICFTNSEGRYSIIYSTLTAETRIRFTLAHELGHMKIPWHIGMIFCHTDEEENIDKNEYNYMEIEANTFASELLMPRDWLDNMVNKYISNGFEELVKKVYEQADVSYKAAFFALINILPRGKVVFIEDYLYYDYKVFKSHDTKLPKISNLKKIKWLACICDKYEISYSNNLFIQYFDLGEILDEEYIKRVVLGKENINIDDIFNDKYISKNVGLYLPYIIDILPSGYIFKIDMIKEKQMEYLKSNNTSVNVTSSKEESDNWYYNYCSSSGEYINESNQYKITWWYFEVENKIDNKCDDIRSSKEIINDIVSRNYSDGEKHSILCKINGVIGALNGKRLKLNIDMNEFYIILNQKFIGREDLKLIIYDRDFEIFLIKKTRELYKI